MLNLLAMPDNKVIVVSGGASGIGSEVSTRLAAEGAFVVIADLNAEQALAKAAELVAAGGQAIGVACDITNPELCEAVAQAAVDKYGKIDGLVNCAGISKPHDSISLPPADWALKQCAWCDSQFSAAAVQATVPSCPPVARRC